MMTIEEAKTCLRICVEKDYPAFWWGPPGVGKSEGVHQVAEDLNYALIDVRASQLDAVDSRGLPIPNKDKTAVAWIPPAFLPNAKRDGKHGFLFLDELNTAAPSVMNAFLQLINDRRLGDYILPKGWYIIAAGNRQSDRAAVNRMPKPLANRFAHFEIEVDAKAWVRWAIKNDLNPLVIYFIRFRPNLLHSMVDDNAHAFPTPRTWTKVSGILDVPEEIRFNLIASLVGKEAAGEMEAFIETNEKLPDIDDILADPKGIKLPEYDEDPSACYAIAGALARVAMKDNFKAVYTAAKRLGREFEMVTMFDATERDEELYETETFNKFAQNNKDLQI